MSSSDAIAQIIADGDRRRAKRASTAFRTNSVAVCKKR